MATRRPRRGKIAGKYTIKDLAEIVGQSYVRTRKWLLEVLAKTGSTPEELSPSIIRFLVTYFFLLERGDLDEHEYWLSVAECVRQKDL